MRPLTRIHVLIALACAVCTGCSRDFITVRNELATPVALTIEFPSNIYDGRPTATYLGSIPPGTAWNSLERDGYLSRFSGGRSGGAYVVHWGTLNSQTAGQAAMHPLAQSFSAGFRPVVTFVDHDGRIEMTVEDSEGRPVKVRDWEPPDWPPPRK